MNKSDLYAKRVGFIIASNQIFVDVSGNDTTGDGSHSNPYKTIQKAIDTVDNDYFLSTNQYTKINIGVGRFSGFTVNKTGVIIEGQGGSMGLPSSTDITSLITLDCVAAPFFIQMKGLHGVIASGNGIDNVNAAFFVLTDCFFEGGEDANSIGLNHSGIGTISIISSIITSFDKNVYVASITPGNILGFCAVDASVTTDIHIDTGAYLETFHTVADITKIINDGTLTDPDSPVNSIKMFGSVGANPYSITVDDTVPGTPSLTITPL